MTSQPARAETDLLIIGAGPTGLFAAYYAGFRGFRVAVVDSLPELGGQITAMYPEKAIFDVAGFPNVKGRDLVDGLVEQAGTASRTYFLDRTAQTLSHDDGSLRSGGKTEPRSARKRSSSPEASASSARARSRPVRAGSAAHAVLRPDFAPRRPGRVIVGGGDSAFDWALHLEPVAASVTLVHRRDSSAPTSGRSSRSGHVGGDPERSPGHGAERRLDAGCPRVGRHRRRRRADHAQPPGRRGRARLHRRPRPAQEWGIDVEKRHAVVDSATRTNLSGCSLPGHHGVPGKVRLIAVGFGEAATAVNVAAVAIDPSAHVFPATPATRHDVASGRHAVRMGDDEIAGFLAEERQGAGRDDRARRRPHLSTLFYVLVEGRIESGPTAPARRSATSNVIPAELPVEDGVDYFELRGVRSPQGGAVREPVGIAPSGRPWRHGWSAPSPSRSWARSAGNRSSGRCRTDRRGRGPRRCRRPGTTTR